MSRRSSTERPPPVPRERDLTVREAIYEALREHGPLDLLELSGLVSVSERDLASHLAHLERSLKHEGITLEMEPPTCQACGFTFRKRRRFKKPGRCPQCRETRVSRPRFYVA